VGRIQNEDTGNKEISYGFCRIATGVWMNIVGLTVGNISCGAIHTFLYSQGTEN
jgi:hypothetical protein